MDQKIKKIDSIGTFFYLFQKQVANKSSHFNDVLYENLLKVDSESEPLKNNEIVEGTVHEKDAQQSENPVQQNTSSKFSSFQQYQSNEPQSLPLNTFVKAHINSSQFSQQAQSLQPIFPLKKSIKLKPNPRMNKFIMQEKALRSEKQKQKERKHKQKEETETMQKVIHQKEKELKELKEKQMKKFQLKEKLRKLNEQLGIEKKQLRSKQKQISFFQEKEETSYFANPEASQFPHHKLSTSFIHNSSFLQKSGLRSRSDVELRVKKLKKQQQVYTPVKHEAAFRLIEKMHAEKLKKHQKIMIEMKRKQEKEIEMVKKLEEEKIKQKNLKRVRQVLYFTPKPTLVKREVQSVRQKFLRGEKESHMNLENGKKKLREFLKPKSRESEKQLIKEKEKISQFEPEISFVLPRETEPQDSINPKKQTLYTEEYEQDVYEPQTQEGRQLAQALKLCLEQENTLANPNHSIQPSLQHQDLPLDHASQQIVVDNEFI